MEKKKYFFTAITIFIIILIFFQIFLMMNLIARRSDYIKPVNDTQIKKNEDIIIDDYILRLTDWDLNGSLIIQQNGTLDLRSTLIIESIFEFQHNITIKDNGILILNNGSIFSTNKTSIIFSGNSSLVCQNISLIELNDLNFNTTGYIEINQSRIKSNIEGVMGNVKINNSDVDFKKFPSETAILNITCKNIEFYD